MESLLHVDSKPLGYPDPQRGFLLAKEAEQDGEGRNRRGQGTISPGIFQSKQSPIWFFQLDS